MDIFRKINAVVLQDELLCSKSFLWSGPTLTSVRPSYFGNGHVEMGWRTVSGAGLWIYSLKPQSPSWEEPSS